MQDLRLVGVHDDGEHLVLVDAQDARYLLGVDEALRAAVRRDRAQLGQLQIEMGGGLRPREVQARIRAGASAEEVAAAGGWPVDRVRRYEGPVLAEREHVAQLARDVRLRRRGNDPVTLGAEVTRRLAGRGIGSDGVEWDSWRTDAGPWTVVVSFAAGGRDRQARWHFDVAGRSVTPADDEARWLSEQLPEGEGPLGGARLAAVPAGSVYDIEADGGVDGTPGRSTAREDHEPTSPPLDLMTAMRSRRRERDLHRAPSTRRGAHSGPVDPADVPGSVHPARRRRPPQLEPLELDPALLGDPPAAHPAASELPPEPVDPSNPAILDPSPPQPARRWPLARQMDGESAPSAPSAPGGTGQPTSDEESIDLSEADLDSAGRSVGRIDDADTTNGPDTARHRAPSRKARRTSVPSWDDIMFGAKRD